MTVIGTVGDTELLGFYRLFRLEEAGSFPTYFSSLALLASSISAGVLHKRALTEQERKGWAAASFVLLFLAVDKACSIYGVFNNLHLIDLGVFFYAWTLPYGIAVITIVVFFLPFWWRLAPTMRWTLAAGAALYVAGALAMELIESALVARSGMGAYETPAMQIVMLIEVSAEMFGVAIVLYALLEGVEQSVGGRLIIRFAGTSEHEEPRSLAGKSQSPINIVGQGQQKVVQPTQPTLRHGHGTKHGYRADAYRRDEHGLPAPGNDKKPR